jgi:hypothetical protein
MSEIPIQENIVVDAAEARKTSVEGVPFGLRERLGDASWRRVGKVLDRLEPAVQWAGARLEAVPHEQPGCFERVLLESARD